MKFYRIKPFDTVVFGENKSSVAGDDHEKGSKFPPEIMKLFNLGDVKFFGVFPINQDGKALLPVPANLLMERKGDRGPYYLPEIKGISRKELPFETDLGVDKLSWTGTMKALERAGGYVKAEDLEKIFNGELNGIEVFKGEAIFQKELRIGISLDFSIGTVQESMLYAHVHLRVGEGFLVAVNKGISHNMLTIGGERKVARIEEEEDGLGLKNLMGGKIQLEKDKKYKFYLTTHAFLSDELKPSSEIVIGDAMYDSDKGIRMKVEWVYSAGTEWISGVYKNVDENGELRKKPGVYMLKPATVMILSPVEDGGEIPGLAQIKAPLNFDIGSSEESKIDKDRFISRGWGSGIIWAI